MSVDAGFAIWGGALAALFSLLVGSFLLKGINRLKRGCHGPRAHDTDLAMLSDIQQDTEHRALMFLMNQKTDSMLAALARTIEQERQKLGVVVRNPSITERVDAADDSLPETAGGSAPTYEQIPAMARKGMQIEVIAHQLGLSEAEVAFVKRLNAA
jgi:hypothetical protein